jgi:glutathione S-transferase
MNTRPILWHIEISHFNEKARWALDFKGVEHERRGLVPGYHMAVALVLTRGRCYTSPILELDGRRIGDSTAIIRALEPLPAATVVPGGSGRAPTGARARGVLRRAARALHPAARLSRTPQRPGRRRAARGAGVHPGDEALPTHAAEYLLAGTALRYGAWSAQAADWARRRVLEALDRLEAELGTNDYLVGERFTVADLTAASLFYPLVLPVEGPVRPQMPATFARFREPLKQRRGFRWVEEMFHRHRGTPAGRLVPVAADD